ncbi:hypothetical protein JCM2811A_34550 [Methylorubrum rhodinum]
MVPAVGDGFDDRAPARIGREMGAHEVEQVVAGCLGHRVRLLPVPTLGDRIGAGRRFVQAEQERVGGGKGSGRNHTVSG